MKLAKRIMALVLACLIMISFVPPVTAQAAGTAGFSDVGKGHKYYKQIMFLYNNGIVNGYDDGRYGVNDGIKREDFVTILWRIAGKPIASKNYNFPDNTNSTTHYYEALRWAKEKGVSTGMGDGTFGVGKKMTNQEAVQFIYNFAQKIVERYGDIKNPLSDSTVSARTRNFDSWAKTAANWAFRNRIVDLLTPRANCTRGIAAMMMYNYYKQYQRNFALVIQSEDAHGDDKTGNVQYSTGGGRTYSNLFVTNVKTIFNNCKLNNLTLVTWGSKTENPHMTETIFDSKLKEAFGNAKCIDNCYLMINSHGAEGGKIKLYGVPDYNRGVYLTPEALHQKIAQYKGNLFVYLDVCYAGTFVEHFASLKSSATIVSVGSANEQTEGHGQALIADSIRMAAHILPYKVDQCLDYQVQFGQRVFKGTCKGNNDGYISLSEFCQGIDSALKTTMCYYSNKPDPYIFCNP